MPGQLSRSRRAALARRRTPSVSPVPMYTSPVTASSGLESSACVRETSSIISSARFRSSIPSSVSSILRLPRTMSCLPSSSSSSRSCRESVGCVRCSACAAAEMLCSLATARKYLSTLNSMPDTSNQIPLYLGNT